MTSSSDSAFALQLRALGPQVAPFIERYVRGWQPFRSHWNYEDGCIFKGCLDLTEATGRRSLQEFVQREVGTRIDADGRIAGFDPDEFNIDNVNGGKAIARLYAITGEERFRRALDAQFSQLERHPRTVSGNYWHKKIYPWQVWLDGLYMAQPFQLEYARIVKRPGLVEDTRRQFAHVRAVMRDARTGLYYHGWDEKRLERWANPQTGCSSCFWGRAMGWFAMALVDCLEILDAREASAARTRALLADMLRDAMRALESVRSARGLWFQVLDQGGRTGNYEEASASLMFAYALMKGARLGVLTAAEGESGLAALRECIARFLSEQRLDGICGVAGLGNVPYRDGTFEYYVSEPVVPNDPKGVGALLMAVAEAVKRQ